LQALCFGLLHGLLAFSQTSSLSFLLLIIILPTIIGFTLGYINEKTAQGSILPSWFIHTAINLFSVIIAIGIPKI
jgi:uncharacterized membrane protein (DUF485 family)